MKTLQAQIPDSLLKQVTALAEQEKTTVDQLVSIALAAQVSAWQTRESIESRARRVDYVDHREIAAFVNGRSDFESLRRLPAVQDSFRCAHRLYFAR